LFSDWLLQSKGEQSTMSTDLIVDAKNERYFQAGRICMVIYGRHYRRLVCVVDFIDRNRVLVDGAKGKLSYIKRSSYPIRWLQLTKYRLPIKRDVPQGDLIKAVQASKIKEIWKKSPPGRRDLCMRRVSKLNDFGRFKLHFIKGQFKKAVAHELLKLRAEKESEKKKKKITSTQIYKREVVRKQVHPTLRRVTGSFKRKLEAKVGKKQRKRKARLLKQGRNFGKLTRKKFKDRQAKNQGQKAQPQPQADAQPQPAQ